MPNALTELSAKQLRQAAALRERIDTLQKQLETLLGPSAAPQTSPAPAKPVKRTFSKATRAKMAARTKARWAKIKASGKNSL